MRVRRSTAVVIAITAAVGIGGLAPDAQAAPGPVHALHAATQGSFAAQLGWTDPPAVSAVLVRYATGLHAPASPTAGTRAGVVHAPVAKLTVHRLRAGTRYAFALFTSDGHGHYAARAVAHVTTAPAPVRNAAPFDAGSYVRVRWTNPDTATLAGVRVRFAKGGVAPASPVSGTAVALSTAKTTSARLAGLALDTRYSISVWTYDARHRYSDAARVHFTTLDAAPAAGSISGTVTDTRGRPLAGVRVAIESFTAGEQNGTNTDSAGHYSLGMLPGGYELGFDGALATGGSADATGYLGDVQDVEVAAGEAKTDVDARLAPGAAITGRVTDELGHPLAGVVPNGTPVVPYVQTTGAFGFFYAFGQTAVAPSAADGTYAVKGLPVGPTRVCLSTTQRNVAGGDSDQVGYVGKCTPRAVLTLTRRTRPIPDLALAANPYGVVTGTVTDPAGQPAGGAFVSVESTDPDSSFGASGTFTQADGTYRIAAPAGRYVVCADPSGNVIASTSAPTCAPTAILVHGGAVTVANVRLSIGAGLAGKVTGPDGKPLANAMVDIEPTEDTGSSGFATTDSHGHFEVTGLLPGSYTVCFAGGDPVTPVPTGVGQTCPKTRYALGAGVTRLGADARAGVGGAISGRITDDQGAPLAAGAFIDVEPTADFGTTVGFAYTLDADGNYTVTGLPTGDYTVCGFIFDTGSTGSTSCYGSSSGDPFDGTPVHVRAGRTTSGIDITVATGGAVTVTVRDPGGRPVGGVDVVALAPCDDRGGDSDCATLPLFGSSRNVSVDGSDTTESDGKVTLSGLAPGDYALCVFGYYGATANHDSATGYADSCDSTYLVPVKIHQTAAVTRRLPTGGTISGTITDVQGRPLAGVQVNVSDGATSDYFDTSFGDSPIGFGGPVDDTFSDANGHYTIHGVRPGAQTVCVDASSATGGSTTTGFLDTCVGGSTPATATAVQVRAGRITIGVDLSLTLGAAISGKVTNSAGKSVDSSEAIAFTTSGQPVAGALPGSNGAYRITRLPAGTYLVCFAAYLYQTQCFKDVAWNGRTLPKAATKIVLTAGHERTHVDAILHR